MVASVACALAADAVPGQPLPAVAMSSGLVWRMEIGAIAFVLLYTVIVVVRLAAAGLTPIRLGTRGMELPQVVATIEKANQRLDIDHASVGDLHEASRAAGSRGWRLL